MAPEVYDDYESGKTCVFYCRRYILDDGTFVEYSTDLLELIFKMVNPYEDDRLTAKEVHKETTLFDRTERGKH